MAKRGRPRKAGRRTGNGRLARQPCTFDRGTERTEARSSLYGTDATDPIGRAYARGLLGSDGKALLDTARAIFRAYWAWYEIGPYRCTLGNRAGGSTADDHERDQRQEDWLNGMLRNRDRFSHDQRRLFDQLVIDPNPDSGPAWMDRLLAGRSEVGDWKRLAAALEVLAQCANVDSPRMAA